MSNQLLSCFHTHVERCGHAVGTEEDMVKAAIAVGIQTIGFSDHVPLPYNQAYFDVVKALKGEEAMLKHQEEMFTGEGHRGIRMAYSQKVDYLESLKQMKKKYGNQINILIGFECEYIESYLDYYRHMLETKEVDYLILGNHFQKTIMYEDYCAYRQDSQMIYEYAQDAIKAFESGIFKLFAHPDLFMRGYQTFDEHCIKATHAMCQSAVKNHIIFEVNGGGLSSPMKTYDDGVTRYPYPDKRFWEIVKEYDIKVVVGLDAHHPNSLSKDLYQKGIDFCNEIGIQVCDTLQLNEIQGQ